MFISLLVSASSVQAELSSTLLCDKGWTPELRMKPVKNYKNEKDYFEQLAENADIVCIEINQYNMDDASMLDDNKVLDAYIDSKNKKTGLSKSQKKRVSQIGAVIFNYTDGMLEYPAKAPDLHPLTKKLVIKYMNGKKPQKVKPTKKEIKYEGLGTISPQNPQGNYIEGIEFVCPKCVEALWDTYHQENYSMSFDLGDADKEIKNVQWTMLHDDNYFTNLNRINNEGKKHDQENN